MYTMKNVILTGIRANNDLHIGNYFGAMLPMIDMAKNHSDEFDIHMFIPDLHSFTTPVDYSQLHSSVMNTARVYAAAGLPLENDSIFLYRQSYVPAHSEMTWILDCFTNMGDLSRMTQFKEKSRSLRDSKFGELESIFGKILSAPKVNIETQLITEEMLDSIRPIHEKRLLTMIRTLQASDPKSQILIELKAIYMGYLEENTKLLRESTASLKQLGEETIGSYGSVGLFNYPVLMAADILLYEAKYVPVGDDQSQHLEFTRDIAERMNSKFKQELFLIPEPVKKQHEFFGKDQGLRVKDLLDPSKKMSKSDETGAGVIFLSDTPEEAKKKIMRATTDSLADVQYDKEKQPGIANLIDILALLRGKKPADVATEYQGMERYGEFKGVVAEEMAQFLASFQKNLADVDDAIVLEKLAKSETAMNVKANETLLRVQKAVGLRI